MLAASAKTPEEAADAVGGGELIVDGKLDGIRVQVHRGAGGVRVYTRSLDEITDRVPEVVEAVAALPGGDLVLDGEAIVMRDDGRPRAVPGDRRPAPRAPPTWRGCARPSR